MTSMRDMREILTEVQRLKDCRTGTFIHELLKKLPEAQDSLLRYEREREADHLEIKRLNDRIDALVLELAVARRKGTSPDGPENPESSGSRAAKAAQLDDLADRLAIRQNNEPVNVATLVRTLDAKFAVWDERLGRLHEILDVSTPG